jgi:hypothetical protein
MGAGHFTGLRTHGIHSWILLLACIFSCSNAFADFVVQVGVFQTDRNASSAARTLTAANYNVIKQDITLKSGTPAIRILIGPYSQMQQAKQAMRKLSVDGWKGFIRTYVKRTEAVSIKPVEPVQPSKPEQVKKPAHTTVMKTPVKESAQPVTQQPETSVTDSPAGEWSGYIAAEARYFDNDPLDNRQHNSNASLSIQPEYYREWNNGDDSILFVPYLRLDEHDSERTHFDIRELVWTRAAEDWELRVGIGKVFWGVTESQHLVDIINQTDLVENSDGEDKLGQPMINLALIRDWGTVNLYALPYFRERTFPGNDGRLRSIPRVDTDQTQYESSKKNNHVDMAVRWSHTFGDWDIGLSHFSGTSRDPRFIGGTDSNGQAVLIPFYDTINQTGIDVQATKGAWLWKLESIRRRGQGDSYTALTTGFEYTLFGFRKSRADLGLLAEYLYDSRGESGLTQFENDYFLGSRLTLNDAASTEMLFGVIVDNNTNTRFYSIEASRRLSNNWKISLEGRINTNLKASDALFSQRNDDYLQLELAWYF